MSSQNNLLQQIIKSSPEPELIGRAFEFANAAHRGQKRFSGEDFVLHPVRVAQILNEMKLDPKTIAAGLLHDVPDDTEKTLGDIEKEFGKEVSFLVEGVSKVGKLRYPKDGLNLKPIGQRLEEPIDLRAENLRKMFFAMAEDLRVILIKLADRLHNMETLGAIPVEKQKRIALETIEVFAPLANRLGMGDMKGRLEDLAFPYLYPKEFDWLMKNVKEKYEEREKYLKRVKPVLVKILEKENIKPIDAHSRAKHYWSLYQKLLRYDMNLEKIYDLVALRTIVTDVETCYRTLGIIHRYWKPLPERIKDYIAFPKPNAYKALHTTCFCLDGKITEIQIKTSEMHTEAEYGICAHWAAKEGIDLKTQGKKFAWVAQLRDWQKEISGSKEFLEGLKFDFFKNRIFVLTPKGDVVDLPEGATCVDFAYAVHTDIGNRCMEAKVNGKISSLPKILKNGDMVEILVGKNQKPSQDWLEFVKTSLARSRIREWLRKKEPLGKEKKTLAPFLQKPIPAIPSFHPPQIKKDLSAVSLDGKTGILVNLAKCCFPQPSDPIKAYITKNRGASVHKTDCENLTRAQKKWPQKIIEASWGKTEKVLYTVSLEIKARDRVGLFRDVSSVISELGINILNCQAQSHSPETPAIIKTRVEVSGLEELGKLFGQLKQVKGVIEVKKI